MCNTESLPEFTVADAFCIGSRLLAQHFLVLLGHSYADCQSAQLSVGSARTRAWPWLYIDDGQRPLRYLAFLTSTYSWLLHLAITCAFDLFGSAWTRPRRDPPPILAICKKSFVFRITHRRINDWITTFRSPICRFLFKSTVTSKFVNGFDFASTPSSELLSFYKLLNYFNGFNKNDRYWVAVVTLLTSSSRTSLTKIPQINTNFWHISIWNSTRTAQKSKCSSAKTFVFCTTNHYDRQCAYCCPLRHSLFVGRTVNAIRIHINEIWNSKRLNFSN